MQSIFIDKVTIMLRHFREGAGLSQSEISHRLKIGLRSYQRYEAGESIPSIDLVYSLGKELGFELKDFFAPHELKDSLPGLRFIKDHADEKKFLASSDIVESKILEFFHSSEFKRIQESGKIKEIKNHDWFMKSPFPLELASPKSSIINPVAKKISGFSSDTVPTLAGQTDPKLLGLIWGILLDGNYRYFEQDTTPILPRGQFRLNVKGIYSQVNQNYLCLNLLKLERLR